MWWLTRYNYTQEGCPLLNDVTKKTLDQLSREATDDAI